jgi:hypothetical protein
MWALSESRIEAEADADDDQLKPFDAPAGAACSGPFDFGLRYVLEQVKSRSEGLP